MSRIAKKEDWKTFMPMKAGTPRPYAVNAKATFFTWLSINAPRANIASINISGMIKKAILAGIEKIQPSTKLFSKWCFTSVSFFSVSSFDKLG